MPELPEVETIVCDLRKNALEGRVFRQVQVFWPRTVATSSPEIFKKNLEGRKILRISRRGKFIVFELNDAWLLIHLRMTGRLDLSQGPVPEDSHIRIQALLDDGRTLRFKDIRKFGRWYFYENEPPQFSQLGPEPLSAAFTLDSFRHQVSSRSRLLKPLLLDQTVVAGLGNIYADESLWEARLHPLLRSDHLKEDRLRALHQAIVKVLERGVRNSGTTLGTNELNYYSVGKRRGRNQDELRVFRRTGQPCPACRGKIIRIVVGQRSTHLCPKCQRKPVSSLRVAQRRSNRRGHS